jgi:hypothetical protein
MQRHIGLVLDTSYITRSKVDVSNLVFDLKRTSIREWCMIRCESKSDTTKQSPGSFVEKTDNFLASRRWLGIFNVYS